ncbi:MAG: hypothetical protein P1U89_18865 [Verrucomicrobiales bacterium]|nr:hypothetical protein [Verrucomicrobiales bacterium]
MKLRSLVGGLGYDLDRMTMGGQEVYCDIVATVDDLIKQADLEAKEKGIPVPLPKLAPGLEEFALRGEPWNSMQIPANSGSSESIPFTGLIGDDPETLRTLIRCNYEAEFIADEFANMYFSNRLGDNKWHSAFYDALVQFIKDRKKLVKKPRR